MTTALIPVYNEVTQLDFTAPHQFLSMVPDIHVIVASVGGAPVRSQGLAFGELADLEAVESCDVLCVPGGLGCIEAIEDLSYLSGVRRLAVNADYASSAMATSLRAAASPPGLIFLWRSSQSCGARMWLSRCSLCLNTLLHRTHQGSLITSDMPTNEIGPPL